MGVVVMVLNIGSDTTMPRWLNNQAFSKHLTLQEIILHELLVVTHLIVVPNHIGTIFFSIYSKKREAKSIMSYRSMSEILCHDFKPYEDLKFYIQASLLQRKRLS